MSDIESKVKAIIVDKLGVDEAEVKNEASFANDLGADSLDTVELIMEFEKEFQIQIPDDQAEKISTVGDAVAYIEANVKSSYLTFPLTSNDGIEKSCCNRHRRHNSAWKECQGNLGECQERSKRCCRDYTFRYIQVQDTFCVRSQEL